MGVRLMSARYKGKEVAGVDYHGIMPADEVVFNSKAERGRYISEGENLHRRDVALIGPDIAKALYPDEDPLGKPILVDGVSYEVIGVMAARKGQLVKDQAADKAILVPYRTYQKHRPGDDENLIGAVAYPGRMAEAEDEIRGVLRRRRNVPYNKPDNFGVSSAKEIADQFRQITASVALLDFRGQFHRTTGGRRRRDEYHADVRHAAHARNWGAQSNRSAAARRDLAVLDRSDCADGSRRSDWSVAWAWVSACSFTFSCQPALRCSVVVDSLGSDGVDERGLIFWNVPRGKSFTARSSRSFAL